MEGRFWKGWRVLGRRESYFPISRGIREAKMGRPQCVWRLGSRDVGRKTSPSAAGGSSVGWVGCVWSRHSWEGLAEESGPSVATQQSGERGYSGTVGVFTEASMTRRRGRRTNSPCESSENHRVGGGTN